jgi:replication-associated recombination protein RarA
VSLQEAHKTSLADLIAQKQNELEKINDKIANYDDVHWIMEKKQKLADKREIVEHELSILMGAESQLKAS